MTTHEPKSALAPKSCRQLHPDELAAVVEREKREEIRAIYRAERPLLNIDSAN